jgi:hypothetical protein
MNQNSSQLQLLRTWYHAGGARRDRTADLLRARQALSQLSYGPVNVVGLGRFELPTSPLSGVRSNQLSYRPAITRSKLSTRSRPAAIFKVTCVGRSHQEDACSLKEVIQPQVPLRLPCYDFTPVMNHTVVVALLAVKLTTSGATHSHGVTGGVYKARERIHRDNADSRLLAIPTSRSRVADFDPD